MREENRGVEPDVAPGLPADSPIEAAAQAEAEPHAPPGKRGRPAQKRDSLLEWLVMLAVALAIALILTQVVFVNAQIPTQSMERTIHVGDRVIGFRMSYWFKDPVRGEIVIFRFPDDESQLFVKRVVGLPGETVEIKEGRVYINGQLLAEDSYVVGTLRGNYGPYQVPDDAYFVMGDNRNESWDSRFWTNTYVTRKQLVGRAVFRIYPKPAWLE